MSEVKMLTDDEINFHLCHINDSTTENFVDELRSIPMEDKEDKIFEIKCKFYQPMNLEEFNFQQRRVTRLMGLLKSNAVISKMETFNKSEVLIVSSPKNNKKNLVPTFIVYLEVFIPDDQHYLYEDEDNDPIKLSTYESEEEEVLNECEDSRWSFTLEEYEYKQDGTVDKLDEPSITTDQDSDLFEELESASIEGFKIYRWKIPVFTNSQSAFFRGLRIIVKNSIWQNDYQLETMISERYLVASNLASQFRTKQASRLLQRMSSYIPEYNYYPLYNEINFFFHSYIPPHERTCHSNRIPNGKEQGTKKRHFTVNDFRKLTYLLGINTKNSKAKNRSLSESEMEEVIKWVSRFVWALSRPSKPFFRNLWYSNMLIMCRSDWVIPNEIAKGYHFFTVDENVTFKLVGFGSSETIGYINHQKSQSFEDASNKIRDNITIFMSNDAEIVPRSHFIYK